MPGLLFTDSVVSLYVSDQVLRLMEMQTDTGIDAVLTCFTFDLSGKMMSHRPVSGTFILF